MPKRLFAVLMFCLVLPQAHGQSLELAEDQQQHGLTDKAKGTLISILHDSSSTAAAKCKALSWLGQISFEEGRLGVALHDWNRLIAGCPGTPEAKEIDGRLSQLKEIVSKQSDKPISSVVARSYIDNGDFWSGADRAFTIDGSWLQPVELATTWYDKVIAEFPNTDGAALAYRRKLKTLLGWGDARRDEPVYGLRANFAKYMPQVLEAFAQFESAFPNDGSLQAFRYQIAQAYWAHQDWEKTREWLRNIISKSGGQTTFYTETAKARLAKVEY
jgi:hypothetical protein